MPPMIVAVVMMLQRIEGCSDREAADRFAFDVRWKYAAGGLGFDCPGFVHTAHRSEYWTSLIGRALVRLARSSVLEVAADGGAVRSSYAGW